MDQKLVKILGGNTEHYPHLLEKKYPRIFSTLMLLWDAPEIDEYFTKLMVNERIDREGFPPEVAAEIMYMSLIHAGQHKKNLKQDIWSPESRMFNNFDPLASAKAVIAWPNIPRETALTIHALGVGCSLEGYFRAAETGNQEAISLFLGAKVHTETRNESDWTALMSAVYNDQMAVAAFLIEHGAHVNASESGGNTPLHWAAFAGRLSCCRLLVANQAMIDARSNFGWTPLYQAVSRNHMVVVAFLVSHGADINASGRDGVTPLHKAAASGSLELIKLLMSHGADTTLTNQRGETPLASATKNLQDEAVSLLQGGI